MLDLMRMATSVTSRQSRLAPIAYTQLFKANPER
jgi:hypothetical protein